MTVAIIGAGPSGLAAARALQRVGIRADGYEAGHGVGGLWDISNPRSTMYSSAHLISSRTTTQFSEFPMRSGVDYPGHAAMRQYFADYAAEFALTELFRFRTEVTRLHPATGGGWELTARPAPAGQQAREVPAREAAAPDTAAEPVTRHYDHVVIANGTLAEPNIPTFPGDFSGELRHTSRYKHASELAGKRVLIVGAGNSGCDIAVDAVHHATAVDLSVRRGYYFVPRYLFGRPSDTLNRGKGLPRPIKQLVDKWVLRAFTGNPARFGFPEPQYRIYESHPVVNTTVLSHLGQGDLQVRPDIDHFDGSTVHFTDGSTGDYDLVLLATGYRLDYPFVDRAELNWHSAAPELFLNMVPPQVNGLFVVGMVEASGLGWQGRYEQAELVAAYLAAERDDPGRAERMRARIAAEPWPDLTGGYRYLGLDRMSYYVDKHTYRTALRRELEALQRPLDARPPGRDGSTRASSAVGSRDGR